MPKQFRPKVTKLCSSCNLVAEHHTFMRRGKETVCARCITCERARKSAYYRKVREHDGLAAEKLRAPSRKYDQSDKGRARTARYRSTPKGQEARRKASARYRARLRAEKRAKHRMEETSNPAEVRCNLCGILSLKGSLEPTADGVYICGNCPGQDNAAAGS